MTDVPRFLRVASLPYPFGARPGAAAAVDALTTAPPIAPLIGRDDPAYLEPNRPGPRSPLAGPLHPYVARLMGLVLDARANAQLAATPRPSERVTLSILEQERTRGLRSVVTRLRTPPVTYAVPYNAAPFGKVSPGSAIARPLPGATPLPRLDYEY